MMPRNQLTRDAIKCEVLKLKSRLDTEPHRDKELAHRYINLVLNKIEEYRY